jgi:hypothetical protein
VILDAVSGELQILGGRRRLSGLFKRHPACPPGPPRRMGPSTAHRGPARRVAHVRSESA